MDKIVTSGLLIDLHIHSAKSQFKDKSVVSNNTIENIQTLIDKLNQYKVNVCSISDHDAFDYTLYKRLKNEEGKGTIVKVFPAVEFTVHFNNNPTHTVHIVSVFSDENELKVENIEKVLSFDMQTNKPKYANGNSFSENEFIEILGKIDLDVICIAHQKNTISSNRGPLENDANSVGEDKYNEFLFSEYFEAFEFKNRKNQVFNNYNKSLLDKDILRFITGSDCHQWNSYPKYSSKSKDDDFKHTYLKCLPNFRGLALALTDDTRISLDNNFFNVTNFHLDSIGISVDGKIVTIPLSHGLNAIIGDNSIGKSLLLHKMTNYYQIDNPLSPLNKQIQDGYEKYLKQHNLEILTTLEKENIMTFDTQGEIRKKFNQGKLKDDVFFKDKYPLDSDTSLIREKLIEELNKVCSYLNSIFSFKDKKDSITNLVLLKERENATSISLIDAPNSQLLQEQTRLSEILVKINQAKTSLVSLKILLELSEQLTIANFIDYLSSLIIKYESLKLQIVKKLKIVNCINTAFSDFRIEKARIKSTADANLDDFLQKEKVFSQNIADLLYLKHNRFVCSPHIEETFIKDEVQDYLKYSFIKRTTVQKFDDEYLMEILHKPLDARKKISITKVVNKDQFKDALKGYNDGDLVQYYKNMVLEYIELDLQQKPVINKMNEKGESVVYSSGLNSQIYFEILSSDRYKNGIYIIDQPEDDVSPKSIKSHLMTNFKDMSRNRQVILVTHNPQFVVNLDVDNVIIFTRSDNNIIIETGALEYHDEEFDVLNRVATLLDGGIETIRKRWKRYVKKN